MSLGWKNASALAALGCAVGFVALGAPAHAQDCKISTDCPKGFSCEVTGSSGCMTIEPACAPGDKTCAITVDAGACKSQDIMSCTPALCTKDADCGADMVCYTSTATTCPGANASDPACTKDLCPTPTPPPDCKTTTEQRCLPRYLAPCKVSADCGAGFDCVQSTNCGCAGSSGGGSSSGSGGAPTPGSDAGSAKPPPPTDAGVATTKDAGPADCTCAPTGELYCQAKSITCDSASQCPSNWTCDQVSTGGGGVACAVAEPAPGNGDAGPGFTCPDAAAFAQPTTQGQCMPPYANLGRGFGSDGSATATQGGDKTSNGGTTAPTEHGAIDGGTGSAAKDSGSGSFCSVTHVGASRSDLAALTLGLLGLIAVSRRRRSARRV